ncbi:MAG TPA: MarR family transcriptional regulator [Candidatus Acidoferrum sp.]|jgi:DNA-binding MarR family transcriptional regulator
MSSRSKDAHLPRQLEEATYVAILRAADSLSQLPEQIIKGEGLTSAQYNVLRILRGAEPEGLPCNVIGERMISRDPDMTRMLDRMEKRGLITRQRQKDDRRVIKARVTEEGLKLLKKLDTPIRAAHKEQFRHIGPARLKSLSQLLEELGEREST